MQNTWKRKKSISSKLFFFLSDTDYFVSRNSLFIFLRKMRNFSRILNLSYTFFKNMRGTCTDFVLFFFHECLKIFLVQFSSKFKKKKTKSRIRADSLNFTMIEKYWKTLTHFPESPLVIGLISTFFPRFTKYSTNMGWKIQ